jgi:hypothetical protein
MYKIIRHRVNSIKELDTVDPAHGVELDLRDRGSRLILAHDPFTDGEDFSDYLQHYRHGTMILNIKSERIEHRVLEEIQKAGTVKDYFFLDSSFPMICTLIAMGERRIAVRYSEFEPIESVLALAGKVEWVWVDCFTKMPLDSKTYKLMKEAGFKLCAVSPELQKRPIESIRQYALELAPYKMDAICTKRPYLWQ